MVLINHLLAATIAGFFTYAVIAHPGEDHRIRAAERYSFLKRAAHTNLDHCADKIKARDVQQRSVERRQALAERLRREAGLEEKAFKKRDLATLLNVSHEINPLDFSKNPGGIFKDNSTCVLQPDAILGPYYVQGEMIRSHIREKQPGIPLFFDIQLLDVHTCEPATGIYIDVWHCNSTGVYSGVNSTMNGNGNPANVNDTFLRGIQKTNHDGVAQFSSIFPGHYLGRATHIHVLTHAPGGEVQKNKTITGLTMNHVGQIYFDQDLLDEVAKVSPYSQNLNPVTRNADDLFLYYDALTTDPFVEYMLLGPNVESGLLGWITIAIDPNARVDVGPAEVLTEDGGEPYDGPNSNAFLPSGFVLPSSLLSLLPTSLATSLAPSSSS